MLHRIRIAGLGPHDDTTIDLGEGTGWVTVSGASEVGKSTMVDAVCWALWGRAADGRPLPAPAVRDGHAAAAVDVFLGRGWVHRAGTPGERAVRTHAIAMSTRGEEAVRLDTEGALQAALARYGDPVVGPVVVAPFAWTALYQGEGGGRPLRDLLVRVTDREGASLRDTVASLLPEGITLRADDPIDQDTLTTERRNARRCLAALEGGARAAREALDSLTDATVDAPAEEAVAAAREVIQAADRWLAYDARMEDHARGLVAHTAATERLKAWTERRRALGDRPDEDESASTAAADAHSKARRDAETKATQARTAAVAVARAERAYDDVYDRLGRARATLAALERSDTACPTCGRSGAVESDRVEEAARSVADLETSMEGAAGERDRLRRLATEATGAAQAAEQRANDAAAALAAARAADPMREWRSAMDALGPQPADPGKVPRKPRKPSGGRPAPADVRTAEETVRAAERATGATEQYEAARQAAQDRLAGAERDREEGAALVAHTEALLEAARQAPGVLARQRRERLGDLGPVSIDFSGDRAIEVLIDGRPWWLASDGRKIIGDMWLRAAIRRAARMDRLPLFVDRAQDVGGQGWPGLPGPVVLLLTTHAPGLTVTPLEGRDAA